MTAQFSIVQVGVSPNIMTTKTTSISGRGFDLRALTYLTHVDDNLCCPICHSPLVDPTTTKCRHTFCSDCIADALEISSTCPVDRTPLELQDITMAPVVIANLVNDLVVLCPNSNLGCTSTQPRSFVGGHLKDECRFVTVDCVGCNERILRRDVHEECMHQEIVCTHCSVTLRKLDLEVSRHMDAFINHPNFLVGSQTALSTPHCRV